VVGVYTGQQDIGTTYPSIPLYLASNATAQYQLGTPFIPLTDRNHYSNLKWEQTTTFNVGLDYGFSNRLTGSVDLYKRTTKDLLLYNPSFFGFSNKDNYNVGNRQQRN
jgi:iron complex outermembrane receptor protein